MELKSAAALLSNDHFGSVKKESWADLGCGKGTFTLALASLLPPDSIIHAVDIDPAVLHQLPHDYHAVKIEKHAADFAQQEMPFKNLDGILMANSLHYIKDKFSFIQNAKSWIKADGCFLVVEYDMNDANKWVPYPVSFSSLKELFRMAGFSFIQRLAEKPSVFGRAKLYSSVSKR